MRIVAGPVRAPRWTPEQLAALFTGGWPAFIEADAVARAHLPRVRELFGGLEVALVGADDLVAAAWGVPLAWDGTVADLPGGYSDALGRALADHGAGRHVDTLVVCAAQVRPDAAGRGSAARVIDGLVDVAATRALHRVVAPLRPTREHRYPLAPIEAYAGWVRPDGLALDPWLRTHHRMGARTVATTAASQVFTGTVAQWEGWSGLALPATGAYVVPDALAPLEVDREADRGTLVEPAVWVRHR